MNKPFFYKIIAAELMSEVLQIPEGKHKEWLTQFVVDLVSAKGSTDYTKKVISETEEYRKKKADAGRAGGKKSKRQSKKQISAGEAKVSCAQAVLNQCSSTPQASNINNIKTTYQEEKKLNIEEGYYVPDGNGRYVHSITGEVSDTPF